MWRITAMGRECKSAEHENGFFDGIDVVAERHCHARDGRYEIPEGRARASLAAGGGRFEAILRRSSGRIAPILADGLKATRALEAGSRELAGGAGQERRAVRTGRQGAPIRQGSDGRAGDFLPDYRCNASGSITNRGPRTRRAWRNAVLGRRCFCGGPRGIHGTGADVHHRDSGTILRRRGAAVQ